MNERVRFWTPRTGMTPQYGTIVERFRTGKDCGTIPYAKIISESLERPVFLCERAVWGYEAINGQARG